MPTPIRLTASSRRATTSEGGFAQLWPHGAMLDKRTARKLLENELLKIYPIEKSYRSLLYINGIYCYEKSYSDVAEALMNKDLHRKNILNLIKNLKDKTENIVFINSRENKQKIKELYPEIYGYNYCLI